MSTISGEEPTWWHDDDGQHRMPDPRKFEESFPRGFWTADEKQYVEHLEAHESTEPLPTDGPEVEAAFELLNRANMARNSAIALIQALRAKAAGRAH